MNKEQIEALIKDGKLASAYVQFADFHEIPASPTWLATKENK